MAFTMVEVQATGERLVTDSMGRFAFTLKYKPGKVALHFTAINYKQTIDYKPIVGITDTIWADVATNTIAEFVVKGLTARQVVEEAVARIPRNYLTESYFAYSFYREYEKVNNRFTNFTEAEVAVMNRLTVKNNLITDQPAFAITHLRRSYLNRPFKDFIEGDLADIFVDDPVYHLMESSLKPGLFNKYSFHFDTTVRSKYYVINYFRPDFSSETHGINGYSFDVFWGESVERGQILIERGTFAIKKVVRKAARNPNYDYGGPLSQINIIRPSKRYFFRFVDGEMVAEYASEGGKWHLSKLVHQYTNDIFQTIFGTFSFRITESSEWYCDSVSRYCDGLLANNFYRSTWLYRRNYTYDSSYWQYLEYPYWFADKEKIFRDISAHIPIEKQFADEANRQQD